MPTSLPVDMTAQVAQYDSTDLTLLTNARDARAIFRAQADTMLKRVIEGVNGHYKTSLAVLPTPYKDPDINLDKPASMSAGYLIQDVRYGREACRIDVCSDAHSDEVAIPRLQVFAKIFKGGSADQAKPVAVSDSVVTTLLGVAANLETSVARKPVRAHVEGRIRLTPSTHG